MSSFSVSFSSLMFGKLLRESKSNGSGPLDASHNHVRGGEVVDRHRKDCRTFSFDDMWMEIPSPDATLMSPRNSPASSVSTEVAMFANTSSSNDSFSVTSRDGYSPRVQRAKAPTAQSVAHLSSNSAVSSPRLLTPLSVANSCTSTPTPSRPSSPRAHTHIETNPELRKNSIASFSFDEDGDATSTCSYGSFSSCRSNTISSTLSRTSTSSSILSLARKASGNLKSIDEQEKRERKPSNEFSSDPKSEPRLNLDADWARLDMVGPHDAKITLRNSSRDREDKMLFDGLLQSIGLQTVSVEGDGNCLFRAISFIVYGTDAHHAMIRYYVCLYIRQRARKCFGSSQAPSPAVVEAYVSRLCLDREWGDEIAVRAAGYLYERPVKVFISDGQGGIAVHPQFPGNIVNNNQNSNSSPGCITNEILLANYSGVTHFDALVTSCPVLWRLSTPVGHYEEARLK
jgi:hypothetical protein